MKNRAKKNNKGFSLVELIVVVLIIGVIAVALAPQVMKWVDTSKKNTDLNNAETLQSSVQAALADWQKNGGTLSTIGAYTDEKVVYNVASKDCNPAGSDDPEDTSDPKKKLSAYIDEVTGEEYPEANTKTGTNDFIITIYESGKVTVECAAQPTPTTAPVGP